MNDRWFAAFCQDPRKAITDLFSGRTGAGSSMRLDVPELLLLWFPPTLVAERIQLDDALLAWLLEMREGYALQVERLGLSVYAKRVGDALIALQLLGLPRARSEIRENMESWLSWLTPLRVAPERDPALECLRLLTQGQPDIRHTATWFRHAVDGRPEYLTVALVGLQRLPNDGDAKKNQSLMLQALLDHAATTFDDLKEALSFFNRRFAALRGLYPRGPQHWQHVLAEVLSRFQRRVTTQIGEALANELRKVQPAKHGSPFPHDKAHAQEQKTGLEAGVDYDHSRKAGNRGDVWKHGVLVALAGIIAKHSGQFRYVESHSGAPVHQLKSENKEWKQGVGKAVGHSGRYASAAKACVEGGRYPAGWVLVAEELSDRFEQVEVILFDDADRVADRYSASPDVGVPENVQTYFKKADGYDSVVEVEATDLAFLDPPYHPNARDDWKRLSLTCRRLRSQGVSFAAWYPFYWPTRPQKLSDSTGCECWEVTWARCGPKPSQNLKGCGMLVSDSLAALLPRLDDDLRGLSSYMEWEFVVRRPQ